MKSSNIRERFLEFFKSQEHVIVPSSNLVPDNDPSVLLTTAGMQQFKPYFLGQRNPENDFKSRRITSVQRVFRTSDIDAVGDVSHCTFFEMLGNFSFGDYFKDGAISMAWECVTKVFRIPPKRLWVTVFAGDEQSVKDFESIKLWGAHLPADRIAEFGRADNWWGPPGMTGPCGPSSEIHVDLAGKACERKEHCVPNCPCGRFVELWNLVFIEYEQSEDKKLTPLQTKSIDTGMGLERLALVLQKKDSVYETDLFAPLAAAVLTDHGFGANDTEAERRSKVRIISDHLKGAAFLIADGVRFSNKEIGYVLRRIVRRALDQFEHPIVSYPAVLDAVFELYETPYPYLRAQESTIRSVLSEEAERYDTLVKQKLQHARTILRSKKGIEERKTISSEDAFTLYSTHGLPLERLKREGFVFDEQEVSRLIEKHRMTSRAGAEKKFGGHGIDNDVDVSARNPDDAKRVTRQHTATHLLHQALRIVLGNHVQQQGSDITPERIRFDFRHPERMTPAERLNVEKIVNDQIQRNSSVTVSEMPLQQALDSGALSFFRDRYPGRVKVYSIGDFSKEICGGPHVHSTGDIGTFRIISEKSSSSGIRRIKAVVIP